MSKAGDFLNEADFDSDDMALLRNRMSSMENPSPQRSLKPKGNRAKKVELDLGDGFTLKGCGMDPNGNYCVWVSKDGGKAKKIQTNGSCPDCHHKDAFEIARSDHAKAEIKDYYNSYIEKRR
jgi:hypothetical protein